MSIPEHIEALRTTLERYMFAYPAFRMKPIGAPGHPVYAQGDDPCYLCVLLAEIERLREREKTLMEVSDSRDKALGFVKLDDEPSSAQDSRPAAAALATGSVDQAAPSGSIPATPWPGSNPNKGNPPDSRGRQ